MKAESIEELYEPSCNAITFKRAKDEMILMTKQ